MSRKGTAPVPDKHHVKAQNGDGRDLRRLDSPMKREETEVYREMSGLFFIHTFSYRDSTFR